MTKKFAFPLFFAVVFMASLFGFLEMWSKAMACADIGHGCRLNAVDEWLLMLVSFPVSFVSNDLILYVFGPNALWPVLLLNSTAWGILVVIAVQLVFHVKKRMERSRV